MWRLVAENFENHLVHLVLYILINFRWCTPFFFDYSIHLRIFFKHTASAMAKQLDQTSNKLLRKNIALPGDTQQYYCAILTV
jgi:hypothetical protein